MSLCAVVMSKIYEIFRFFFGFEDRLMNFYFTNFDVDAKLGGLDVTNILAKQKGIDRMELRS